MEEIKLLQVKSGWSFFIEEEELLSITTEDYIVLRLYEKELFSQEEFEEVAKYAQYKKAKRIAQESNIYKNKSRKELVAKLIQKGIWEDVAALTIEKMLEKGEIDEKDIIQRFIRDRLKFNPKSKNFLKYELLKKGFQDTDIELIIEGLSISDEELARDLVNKRIRKFKSPEETLKFLKNKGFDYNTIKKITQIKNEDFD